MRKKVFLIVMVFIISISSTPAFSCNDDGEGSDCDCSVTYIIRDDWSTGATIDITITNNGATPIEGWTITWTFPGNQQITNLWSGGYTQNGAFVSVTNLEYNAIIPANGGSVIFGFNISYSGLNETPAEFTINGEQSGGTPGPADYVITGSDCSVSYVIREDWGKEAIVDVTITNNTTQAIQGWNITWAFTGYQVIKELWSGHYTQFGPCVSVTNACHNATIQPNGGSVTFGFKLSYCFTNPVPDNFKVNGKNCTDDDTVIQCEGITITIPAGAAPVGSVITITPLTEGQMEVIPEDIPNVLLSDDETAGYDIVLNGQNGNTFLTDILISMEYDPAKIPEYVPEGSVFIFYYDELKLEWKHLKRVDLDTQNNIVTCSTNHFCQMFAGAMAVASGAPQSKGINTNPTSIEKASPLTGIKVINPPAPNNQGTANLSYPIGVPEGINGLTPFLSINYLSAVGTGNCGQGWNLESSSICLDTKDGVPAYDGSDTLLLDGRELVPAGSNTYRYKVESTFESIVWDPYNQGFIVYQTDGMRKYFGFTADSRLSQHGNPSRIFRWFLNRITDKFGNQINYEYTSVWNGSERFQYYLSRVIYGYNNLYQVNLVWDILPSDEINVNCRSGFLICSDKRLNRIYITYDNTQILKQYELYYINAMYTKTLLTTIIERAEDLVTELNRTQFEYDTEINNWFTETGSWYTDPLSPFGHHDIRFSIKSEDHTRTHTEIDLVDFNGDGLPDRVAKHRNDNTLYVQYNTGGFFTETHEIPVDDTGFCPFGYKDLRFSYSNSEGTRSRVEIDFLDFNRDGRPDRVAKHRDDNTLYIQYNTGSGFTATRQIPVDDANFCSFGDKDIRFTYSNEEHTRSRVEIDLVDINGDGLPDRVAKHRDDNNMYVQYNTGTGFTATRVLPVDDANFCDFGDKDLRFTYSDDDQSRSHVEIDLMDINGDGLPDRVAKHRDRSVLYIQYNTGYGFTVTHTIPMDDSGFCPYGDKDIRFTYSDGDGTRSHTEIDFVDINGDGLPDRVAKHRDENVIYVQLNKGRFFTNTIVIPVDPMNVAGQEDLRYTYTDEDGRYSHTEIDFVDINGDGLPDRVAKHRDDRNFYYQLNQLTNKSLLTKVVMTTGAEIQLGYRRTFVDAAWNQSHNYMQKTVINSLSSGKPDVHMNNMWIAYYAGTYDRIEREFRGFKKTRVVFHDLERPGITGATETEYMVDNATGALDIAQNPYYDQYIKGLVDTVTNKVEIVEGGEYREVLTGKVKNIYEKRSHSYNSSMFVYLAQKRSWIYNTDPNDNRFIGIDEVNGDLIEENFYEFDYAKGLISRTIKNEYHDPFHNNDDLQIVTDMNTEINNINRWCLPSRIERIKMNGNRRIFLKTIDYNSIGGVFRETTWNNVGADPVTTYEYDTCGNMIVMTRQGGLNIYTTTNYLPGNNLYVETITSQPQLGLTEITRYDLYGRIVETVDTCNKTSRFMYDQRGRPVRVQETIGGNLVDTKSYTYGTVFGSDGRTYYVVQVSHINDLGTNDPISVQYFKDAIGREVQIKTESVVNGSKVWVVSGHTEYDLNGMVIRTGSSFTVPYAENNLSLVPFQMIGPTTTYTYDELGRNISTIMPSGLITSNKYDTIIDTDNPYTRVLFKTTNSVYDSTGLLVQQGSSCQDMLGQEVKTETLKDDGTFLTVTSTYDLQGYSTISKGPDVGIVETQKDSLGRVSWYRTPDAGTITYEYDNTTGFLVHITERGKDTNDSTNRTTHHFYNNLLQLASIDHDGTTEDVTLEYYPPTEPNLYARNRIRQVTKGNGYRIQYSYGEFVFEEAKTIDNVTYVTQYDYDIQGRISALTYPDGEVVVYTYNEGGLLKNITGDQVYVDDIQYNQYGLRSLVRYGNGTMMTYTYDPDTLYIDIFTTCDESGQELMRYGYTFNDLGHVTSVVNGPNGLVRSRQTYEHDTFTGRLDSSSGEYYTYGVAQSYNGDYETDDYNRLVYKAENNTRYSYTYIPGTHALDFVTKVSGYVTEVIQFVHDDFGNVVQKITSDTNQSQNEEFTYNQDNNVTSLIKDDLELLFDYDHAGQRIKKVFRDDVAVIKETIFVNGFYTFSSGLVNKHISDGKGIVATKQGNQAALIKYYHSNHLGSTSLLTDANGDRSQSYLYYPYGETWIKASLGVDDSEITRLFTGQEFDQESGLYYYNARYYDPALGVFISPDPALDGFDIYTYCRNNPVIYTDPSGLWALGLGLVVSWTPSHGWGIGMGVAAEFGSGEPRGDNLGFNISHLWNQDRSETTSFGAQGVIELGIIAVNVGAGYSYNTETGHTASGVIGGNLFGLGAEAGASHYWSTSGDYLGGSVYGMGYIGSTTTHVGTGYQHGWGIAKGSTGAFSELKIMGVTLRNQGNGWELCNINASLYVGSSKHGNYEDHFIKCSVIEDFKGMGDIVMPVFTAGALIVAPLYYLASGNLESIGVTRNKSIDIITKEGRNWAFGFVRRLNPGNPKQMSYSGAFSIYVNKHEMEHINQELKYGLYYFLSYGYHAITGPVEANPWEIEADEAARVSKK